MLIEFLINKTIKNVLQGTKIAKIGGRRGVILNVQFLHVTVILLVTPVLNLSVPFAWKKEKKIYISFRELLSHFHYAPNKLGCSPSIRWLHGELTCHKFTLWGWWQGRSQSSWKKRKKMSRGSHPPTPRAPFQPHLTLYPHYWSTFAPYPPAYLSVSAPTRLSLSLSPFSLHG